MIGDDAVEGSEDLGKAKVDGRGFDVGLIKPTVPLFCSTTKA